MNADPIPDDMRRAGYAWDDVAYITDTSSSRGGKRGGAGKAM
jgi:hypothetical protein